MISNNPNGRLPLAMSFAAAAMARSTCSGDKVLGCGSASTAAAQVAVLWYRTYWRPDQIEAVAGGRSFRRINMRMAALSESRCADRTAPVDVAWKWNLGMVPQGTGTRFQSRYSRE